MSYKKLSISFALLFICISSGCTQKEASDVPANSVVPGIASSQSAADTVAPSGSVEAVSQDDDPTTTGIAQTNQTNQTMTEETQQPNAIDHTGKKDQKQRSDVSGQSDIWELARRLDNTTVKFSQATIKRIVELGRPPQSGMIDYFAPWCGPCRRTKPIVEKLIKQGYRVRTINTDEEDTPTYFIPTFSVYIDGEEVDRAVGGIDEAEMRKLLEQIPEKARMETQLGVMADNPPEQARAELLAYLVGLLSEDHWTRFDSMGVLQHQGAGFDSKLQNIVEDSQQLSLVRGLCIHALTEYCPPADAPRLTTACRRIMGDSKLPIPIRSFAAVAVSRYAETKPADMAVLSLALSSAPIASLRADAAGAIAKLSGPEAAKALAANLSAEDDQTMEACATGLAACGADAWQYLPQLFETAKNRESKALSKAVMALSLSAPESANVVIAMLDDPETCPLALEVLPRLTAPMTFSDKLVPMLSSDNDKVRTVAAQILGRSPQHTAQIVPILIKALADDEDDWATKSALQSLQSPALTPLLGILRDNSKPDKIRETVGRLIPDTYELRGLAARIVGEPPYKGDQLTQLWLTVIRAGNHHGKTDLLPLLKPGLKLRNKASRACVVQAIANLPASPAVNELLFNELTDEDRGDTVAYALRDRKLTAQQQKQLHSWVKEKQVSYGVAVLAARQLRDDDAMAKPILDILKAGSDHAYMLTDAIASRPNGAELLLREAVAADTPDELKKQFLRTALPTEQDISGVHDQLVEMLNTENELAPLVAVGLVKIPEQRKRVLQVLEKAAMSEAGSRDAVEGLVAIPTGDDVLAILDRLLQSESGKVVATAIEVLRQRQVNLTQQQAAAIGACLKTEKPGLPGYSAVGSLLRSPAGEKVLVEVLKDGNDKLRREILGQIDSEGDALKSYLPVLRDLHSHKDAELAAMACYQSVCGCDVSDSVLALVQTHLRSENERVVSFAVRSTTGLKDQAFEMIPRLLELRHHQSHGYQVSEALQSIAADRPAETAELVLPLMLDDVKNNRDECRPTEVIRTLGEHARPSAETLTEVFFQVRYPSSIARILAELDADVTVMLPRLIGELDDAYRQEQALRCLRYLGKADPEIASKAILPITNNPDPELRDNAVQALGGIAWQGALQKVLQLTSDPNEEVQSSAVHAVGAFKDPGPEALARVLEIAEDPEHYACSQAVVLFVKLTTPKQSVPKLRAWLKDDKLQLFAVRAVHELEPDSTPVEFISQLLPLLDGDHWYDTARALAAMGPKAKAAHPTLKRLLKTKTERWEQTAIRDAIDKITID